MNNFEGDSYHDLKRMMEKAIPREKQRDDTRMYIKSCFWVVVFCICLARWIYYSRVIDFLIYIFVTGQTAINIMHDAYY